MQAGRQESQKESDRKKESRQKETGKEEIIKTTAKRKSTVGPESCKPRRFGTDCVYPLTTFLPRSIVFICRSSGAKPDLNDCIRQAERV